MVDTSTCLKGGTPQFQGTEAPGLSTFSDLTLCTSSCGYSCISFNNILCNNLVSISVSLSPVSLYSKLLLPNQVHFAQCTVSQNTEILRLAAKRGLIHEAAKQGDRKTNLRPTSLKAGSSGYLWGKTEAWGAWGKVIRKRYCNHSVQV